MIQLTTNGHDLILVEAPENSFDFYISNGGYVWWRLRTTHNWDEDKKVYVGQGFQLIGLLRELKPEQVEPYVEREDESLEFNFYRNYQERNRYNIDTAKESFGTLLQSNNIDPTRNYYLIEKVK